MIKNGLVICFLLSSTLHSIAHEFWLLPQQFSYQAGQKVYVRFQVGENFTGENWHGDKDKINLLKATSNNYQFELIPFLENLAGILLGWTPLYFRGITPSLTMAKIPTLN